MNSIDIEDKREKILKYAKYLVLIFLIIGIILIVNSCKYDYNDVEDEVIEASKSYISKNNIVINQETYINIVNLEEIEGTELCSKASGVIVNNKNGKLTYQVYLKCLDYQSDIIENKNNYIELYDSEVILLNQGEVYKEPGYLNKKGVIIEEITDVKSVPGIYNVYYKAYEDDELKETVTRKVIVSEYDKDANISGLVNKEVPTLTLLGDTKIIIGKGETYREPGYLAVDYKDGKISRNIKVNGSVNSNAEGKYLITYTVTNSNGKTATAIREVEVVKRKADLQISILADESINNSSNIRVSILGVGYDRTILPNGKTEYADSFTYTATTNQTYTFKIYDIYENEFIREVQISNLDTIGPTGTCSAIVSRNGVNISVNATDNKGISSYTYFVNSKELKTSQVSNFNNPDKYTKETIPAVKVNVKDIAGNVSTISCNNVLELTPNVYKDVNGYDCLEPYICYKQRDYSDPYQATINGVGTLYRSGCLPTALTIISTKYNKKSINGDFYTPPTLVKEIIYPDGKIKGYSNYVRVTEVANALNLKISQEYKFNDANMDIFINHLKDGNPILILVSSGCYSSGGHYMAVLGINDEGKIFLSDPYMRGTSSMTGKCSVNTWVDISDLKNKGSVREFVLFNE